MNTTPDLAKKEEYAKAVCFFLSEMLRTHKISFERSAEIAQRILENINLIDTEEDFLKLIKELSKDFEELVKLEEQAYFRVEQNDRKSLDHIVREFVIYTIAEDLKLALTLLQEVVNKKCTPEELCAKYPQFDQFVEKNFAHIESSKINPAQDR